MNLPTSPKRLPDINYQELDWLFDKTKSEVFMGRGAGFLGSIMSTLNFAWTSDIKTACTNGVMLLWNPYFFLKLPPKTRRTILKHELWHVAYLDMLRVGSRDFTIWNYACDIRINNNLTNEGETFEGFSPWLDHQYDDLSPEEIYDIIWPQGMDALINKYGASAWGHEPTEAKPEINKWMVTAFSPDGSENWQSQYSTESSAIRTAKILCRDNYRDVRISHVIAEAKATTTWSIDL